MHMTRIVISLKQIELSKNAIKFYREELSDKDYIREHNLLQNVPLYLERDRRYPEIKEMIRTHRQSQSQTQLFKNSASNNEIMQIRY